MISRKRKTTSTSSRDGSRAVRRSSKSKTVGKKRRQHLLETLEARQLLAGPQLTAVQPNDGDLYVDGTIRNAAPRVLTFRFNQDQQIAIAETAVDSGIRITRAGPDGLINTADDVPVDSGSVSLGDNAQNEVIVRFSESLVDDDYQIQIFGFDDPGRGIVGLRNTNGELLVPRVANASSEIINFRLDLGALVESVVPQPVVRDASGNLHQNRNEIVVYFNEDPLFVENDPVSGLPTARSAENPRFYQLLLTQDTLRTTDDVIYQPSRVVYDATTHTARLLFFDGAGAPQDINTLPGVPLGGGTFRLRIGTAVDTPDDLILQPSHVAVPSAVEDFDVPGFQIEFLAQPSLVGATVSGQRIRFERVGVGSVSAGVDPDGTVVFNLRDGAVSAADLRAAVMATPAVSALIDVIYQLDGVAFAGGTSLVPARLVGAPPLVIDASGDTLGTAFDVGVFGLSSDLVSIVLSESINPQVFNIELPGGNSDPGHLDLPEVAGDGLIQHLNSLFGENGADITPGITEISYNFKSIFDTLGSSSFLNQITERQKDRIREALNLWSSVIGVQFRETVDMGITFAVGTTTNLQPGALAATTILDQSVLNSRLRIDPTFSESAIVFNNQVNFNTAYGEDFLRKATAGIGLLLGLETTPELPIQTLMTLSSTFLNRTINGLTDLEPVFPGNYDVLHGQHLYRPESNDVDLYRFEVDLGDPDKFGTLTAETFAERLPDSSGLDTTLTLFQQVDASAVTNFDIGPSLAVRFDAVAAGKLGNNVRIDFLYSDRPTGDATVRISQPLDNSGNPISNGIVVDMPRRSSLIPMVPVSDVIDAINASPLATSVVRAMLVTGSGTTDVSGTKLNYSPVLLSGGGLKQLSRNDDYFSEDSRIIATLDAGVYYVGVAASGNNTYDPTITASGFGGLTQGEYDLHLKFEPQVDEDDVIRDLDSDRMGVPGTPIDGDGDGIPGGVNNFWFQTRPLDRTIEFVNDGAAINEGQTITITGGTSMVRTYEFVTTGTSPQLGNVPVTYETTSTPSELADRLALAINDLDRITATGVTATVSGTLLVLSGERSIDLSDDFLGASAFGRTIFVDKSAGPKATGTLARPFNNISNPAVANAFGSTISGDIVRIVGNGGLDGNIATEADNFSYRIGVSDTGGLTLTDGRTMNVPQGVTTMIDAGAILKFRSARIGVGSTSVFEDRSESTLQVLGAPRLVQLSLQGTPVSTMLIADTNALAPDYSDGSVILTSLKDRQADTAAAGSSLPAGPGDWGGIDFRRDLDKREGRDDLEDEGIFLQTVNHAQIRYGGSSNLLIDSKQLLVNPIQVFDLRPTITFNEISFSADAAISASPDAFEETSYQSPRFQQAGEFTADYSRIGPTIHNNRLVDNSINGLFIRIVTGSETPPQPLTVAGRFDDIDVVHYFAENLFVQGTPGGSIQDAVMPDLVSTAFAAMAGGSLAAGTYDYRLTFVDANGFESLASPPSASTTVAADSTVRLINLPPVPNDSDYLTRNLYRLDPASGDYFLIAQLDASGSDYIDGGQTSAGVLDLTRLGIRGRLDASLVIDPGAVLKFRGARLELGQSTQLLAEGLVSDPVIFTSYGDDRFGSGGTFNTTNDNGTVVPARGDWSGIYAGPTAFVSLDHATVAYGGGVSLLQGGQSRGFVALDLQQADARVTNSRFEFNEDGQDGVAPSGRFGRLAVTPSTIFVRGSQPTIIGNEFVDNRGATIDIDSESMSAERLVDLGRQTGDLDRFAAFDDNYGPLVRLNRFQNVPTTTVANQQISGLLIRGGELTTASVWDDTDIVHLLFDAIEVGNFHSSGGLRLLSNSDESLVVKLSGAGSPFSPTAGTGFTAFGTQTNIEDRIGGSIHIIGLPGTPVILTSYADDTVGAGLTPQGTPFTDNNGDSFGSRPEANDWRGITFDEFSNDRNVDYVLERTLTTDAAPGLNGTVTNAQVIGMLAPNLHAGNDQQRLGFEVEGFLSECIDVDTYSMMAEAGTRIWLDVDYTSFGLDTVVEILDVNGNVLARSDNSFAEVAGTPLQDVDPLVAASASSLAGGNTAYTEFGVGGLYDDFGSTNPRDAGISLTLPGTPGLMSVYFFRVRSASVNPDDHAGGITDGGYRFQVRLQEDQEFPGSVVRHADIRYANNGIHVRGLMSTSPLIGEAQENEEVSGISSNNSLTSSTTVPGQRAQYLGNLLVSEDKVFSVGGALSSTLDIDFYQIDVQGSIGSGDLQTSTVFDIDYAAGFNRPDTTLYVYYDADGESGPLSPQLVLVGENSNVLEDQAKPISSSPIDLLKRGSVSSGDPFIGPVSLSEGSYFVAVVADGRVADALSAITTRREPIESILRIFEDHIEEIGGSTALAPREADFIDTTALPAGWTVTLDRATDPGHQRTETFNGSRTPTAFPTSVQDEIVGLGGTFATAQDLEADPAWSLSADPNIGNTTANTSQILPHTTVNGTTPNEIVDIYQFVVTTAGSTVILDIDNGFNPLTDPANLPMGATPVVDPSSVNLKLQLFDSTFTELQINSSNTASFGALGSDRNSAANPLSEDPYIQTTLPVGTYFVAVSPEATTYDPVLFTFDLDPAMRPTSGTYELNVTVENHLADGGIAANQSIRFDRSVAMGTVTSEPFDLTGYGPNDLPRFYFNYFYDPAATDSVTIRARSNENPGGAVLTDVTLLPLGATWRQEVASLSGFAGDTGIVIEFEYTTVPGGTEEGLYLDDFLVGFAERGELITAAGLNDTGISGTPSGADVGEYQLEIRPGTEYGTPIVGGLTLDATFDTNARQAEVATIVAPHADQIVDGNTFTLSDGLRSVRFEFDLDTSPGVVPGNIRVPYTATSAQSEIADAIRTAINLPVVQSTIRIQASDSTGSASGGFGDIQVAIAGALFGDFIQLDQPGDLPASGMPLDPAGGPFRLPVVFHRGVGDENVKRSQSQVIIENNKISHVRAIGILSEPGTRGTDPEDPTNAFLDRPPVGSTFPGAVRNLPTLNNEVIGGQTPGILIQNNTVDQAGFASVKVAGEIRPFVIDSSTFDAGTLTFGDIISDGLTMTIDAAGVRVVFEFEDIGGAATTAGGSGSTGGNGYADGHVPIYFRHTNGTAYNGRTTAHTRHEVMLAIYDAINSSILVNNGMHPLVKATLGSSLRGSDVFGGGFLQTSNAAVYVEGATSILFSFAFLNPPIVPALNPFNLTGLAPVHDAPQPLSRIVNNTFYGEDGTASTFPVDVPAEPNDLLSEALDPRVGNAHTGPFITSATIGDSTGLLPVGADVDLYRVHLGAGDRLTVDVDTLATGPDTVLRVFDSRGVQVDFNQAALAPDYLETAANPANFDSLIGRAVDPFIDFTAREEGIYYVGVSSAGNETYDPNSLSGRTVGTGGTGAYTFAMEVYAPRSFVISLDNGSNARFPNANTGTQVADLVGTTFTITQIPDRLETLAGSPTNQLTFEFSAGAGGLRLANGNVNIPLAGNNEYRVPDVMTAIADAISGVNFVQNAGLTNPPLPNHRFSNGPDGLSGPIAPVDANALGGIDGTGAGLRLFPLTGDFNTSFGHNRTAQVGSSGFGGTSTLGNGVSELYVLVERAAEITISPEAAAAGLRLDPAEGLNIDQLLPETGVLLTGGSSGTMLNNVFSNLHQGLVVEETKTGGFFPIPADVHPKPSINVATANVFQHIETNNNVFRQQMTQPFSGSGDIGIIDGPSNINGGVDDFNITLGGDDPLFVFPEAGNFIPDLDSLIIDSAVNSLIEGDRFSSLKQSVGLPISNILAPDRDINGIFRADNPNVAPPGGLGHQIFKDRGSNELADFVGPVALADVPRDNDSQGVDTDPAVSFIQLASGVYREFRIQLRDTGDSSDPFAGFGVDDDTVVVAAIDGLRAAGANFTLFENDRLLVEGIDYTFSYDTTQNVVIFTPLTGIWQNDRSYRISINNKSRTVLIAPSADQLADGDQLTITDATGGATVFEFESGFQLLVPDALTLVVPAVGTNAGGLSDGGVFQIDDGVNAPVIFEFDSDGVTLSTSVNISLPTTPTPDDATALQAFLEAIAADIAAAINSIDNSLLDVDATAVGTSVVIGSEAGTVINTSGSGLTQPVRTLALRAPEIGTGAGGIVDMQTFTINDGSNTIVFEIDTNATSTSGNTLVPLVGTLTGEEVAIEISRAITQSGLKLTPTVTGSVVYLNLPLNGSVSVSPGQLTGVGLSRTPTDGDLITVTPIGAGTPVALEINRDDVDMEIPPVMQGNVRIDITRSTTADELAQALATALQGLSIAGLDPDAITAIAGGQLSIGGQAGVQLEVSEGSNLQVVGAPSVTGASTLEVFGPLLLSLPFTGGQGIQSGSVLILKDNAGNDVIFEFNLLATASVPGANLIQFTLNDTAATLATNLITAINAANIGITASLDGFGRVSLGLIESSRVVLTGIPGDEMAEPPVDPIPGVPQITTRRGIVNDGDVVLIQQGTTVVRFEFESVNNGGGVADGNVQVVFQPGSTPGAVALALAAAINNNKGDLVINAVAELDDTGAPTGKVNLNDVPGTNVSIIPVTANSPRLRLTGVPGGAVPVQISPTFSAEQVKQALILAINSLTPVGGAEVTTLTAVDRGGDSFFIENGELFNGPLANFLLPAVADLVGNPIEANRQDQTTQFTILMPTVALDYGDAPDPVHMVDGRYPTLRVNDGPRHVITNDLTLGQTVDGEPDGQPSIGADGDDLTISVTNTGTLFMTSVVDGKVSIVIDPAVGTAGFPIGGADGDTITINTSNGSATLEFVTDGIFDEDNYAIKPADLTSAVSIGNAIREAIVESSLSIASVTVDSGTGKVTVSGDDEDGVSFSSAINPAGVLNKNIVTPITVGVRGAGTVDAWIDFNADGDFDDEGEQIISASTPGAIFSEVRDTNGDLVEVKRTFDVTVPATAPDPLAAKITYARFRVSRGGNLTPTQLALSGENEDYAVQLVPGAPPTIPADRLAQSYTTAEDISLNVATASGLLAGITDPDGDGVAIFAADVGTRVLMTLDGTTAGTIVINADGSFDFDPALNFNGSVSFTVNVTDVKPTAPSTQLVNSQPITVTLVVTPVNDPPFVVDPPFDVITRSTDEDVVFTLGATDLFTQFSPGPANEAGQPLLVASAGGASGMSALGGMVEISPDGQTITYTPPMDLGGVTDSFTYTVADDPGPGQISQTAALMGMVTIDIASLNDPPIANPDTLSTAEDTPLPFTAADLIGNDLPGPSDEQAAGQTVSLGANQFPKTTARGGQVRVQGSGFVYEPPALVSGIDTFTYTVVDNLGAMSTGTVTISVGAVNNAPRFIGIDGDATRMTLTFDESKQVAQKPMFNLNTWFDDPDGDALTFTVTSQNSSLVAVSLTGSQLMLTLPPFTFGATTITIVATDPSGLSVTKVIPVTVNNTPDPPMVIGTLDPLNALEDQVITADLSTVFSDPDLTQLTYSVARLGTIVNPTAAQIAAHPLIESITFVGDQMRILLDPNQFGSVEIEISATDGSFRVSDTFTLNVASVPDAPLAVADEYNVPVGSVLSITSPALGLLRNDSDGDGDTFTVDAFTQPMFGTVTVNSNGTFTYTNTSGEAGKQDQFTYRIIDSTGLNSTFATVTLNLGASPYQNPLTNLSEDVNADGYVSAIDALQILNFLRLNLADNEMSVPVSRIGAPPPPFYDVNGDGRVSSFDASLVVNRLREANNLVFEKEFTTSVDATAAASITTNIAPPSFDGPVTNEPAEVDPRDAVLAGGLEITSSVAEQAVIVAPADARDAAAAESTDEALSSWIDELSLNEQID